MATSIPSIRCTARRRATTTTIPPRRGGCWTKQGSGKSRRACAKTQRASACRSCSPSPAAIASAISWRKSCRANCARSASSCASRQRPRAFISTTLTHRKFDSLAFYAWVMSPENVPRTTLQSTEIPTAANGWSGQNFPGYRNSEMDHGAGRPPSANSIPTNAGLSLPICCASMPTTCRFCRCISGSIRS